MQEENAEDNDIDRRTVLKNFSVASIGVTGAVGTSTALPNSKSKEGSGKSEGGCPGKACPDVTGETYVENDDYIYRRIRTPETDILVQIETEVGKVEYAELSTGSGYTTQEVGESLEKKTQSMVSKDVSVESDSKAIKSVSPAKIATNTDGITIQDEGTIFSRVDVEVEEDFGDCGNFLYSDHNYYQVSMEFADHDLDDIEEDLGYAVVCSALFTLIGSKSSTFKKLLTKLSGGRFLSEIPGTICGFIFGDILDGIFDGDSGTLAIWDYDEEDFWGTTPYIAFGGHSEYEPDPDEVRDVGLVDSFPTFHTDGIV